MEISTDILAELRSCRLLLEMLTGRIIDIEYRLFPQPGAEGTRDGHAFLQMGAEGTGDSPAFLQPKVDGTVSSPAFHQLPVEGMRDSAPLPTPSIDTLYQRLKAGEYKGRSGKTLHNIATFLCHLHQSPTGNSHIAISKLTGMSGSGVGKMLMALHRRGLIQKEGWQHYILTPKAIGILRQAALSAQS